MPRRDHSTGLTIVAVAVLAVGLSLAPLPDSLRPFPALRSAPVGTLQALLLPSRGGNSNSSNKSSAPAWDPDHGSDHATAGTDALPTISEEEEAAVTSEQLSLPPVAPEDMPPLERLALVSLGPTTEANEARRLEALAKKMAAPGAEVVAGCRQYKADATCAQTALAPFFDALTQLHRGDRHRPVRVVHLGDSLIASDHITDVIRRRMQVRHGSGGRGFLFVDRPTRDAGRTVRTGHASPGWAIEKLTDRAFPKRTLGFSGVAFTARSAGERTEFDTTGARVAELYFRTMPKGGSLELRWEGKRIGQVLTHYPDAQPATARLELPEGAGRLTVAARGGPVQLYGVSLETGGPGIVYDSIGLPGATAEVLLGADEDVFRAQMQRRAPSLVVVMLGGNEAFELSKKRAVLEEARASFNGLVARVREATPEAACLLIGPMDAAVRTMGGNLAPRPGTEEVTSVVREVAEAAGCAYWDMLGAMGGVGTAQKWLEAGMLNEDLVHPRAAGADLLGHLFDMALERAYLAHLGPHAALDTPGIQDAQVLKPFFAALARLEDGSRGRVAIAQLGGSLTASPPFAEAVRARLNQRFGDPGRGYVPASGPLMDGQVERTLSGPWTETEALGATEPGLFSLAGTRVELAAGAEATFRFCARCGPSEVRARVDLSYVEAAGMGQLAVLLDDTVVARPQAPPAPEPDDAGTSAGSPDGSPGSPPERPAQTRVLTFGAAGPSHTLTLRNEGPGTVSLLGASWELLQPGVVFDALGLPGATFSTLAAHAPAALRTQLEARAPDLLVLAYGASESADPILNMEHFRTSALAAVRGLRAASPDAACLVVAPPDRQVELADGTWRQAPALDWVISSLRKVAREQGCAYWAARAAMGGVGAVARWRQQQPALAHPDGVTLTPEGHRALAGALVDDLLAAYQEGR